MGFSGALTITDLDDFLTPSQACIIPVRKPKTTAATEVDDGPTEIHIDSSNNYYEVSTFPTSVAGPSSGASKAQGVKALEKAEINLNDCLACSGCVTSAESILITMQSHNEVLDFIRNTSSLDSSPLSSRTPVLSISPQSLASLSASYSTSSSTSPIPLQTLLHRIRSFLSTSTNGSWRTWDTTFARHLSLRESVLEFNQRKAASASKGKGVDNTPPSLPMLASACPGWVCYAEKAQGDMLPLLSQSRSSQGMMGSLVKQWWGNKMGLKPDQIYHVTAMPCYDKKLEASRSDFYSSVHSTRDVDCVFTTGELDLLLSELGFDPLVPVVGEDWAGENVNVESTDLSSPLSSPFPEMLLHPGSSSGGYIGVLLSSISKSHVNPTRIITREIRSSTDNVEYLLEDTITGEVIFKGSKCYGFRNLQNLVRKVGKETGTGKGGRGGVGGGGASKLSAAIAARRRKARTGVSGIGSGDATPGTEGSDAESILGIARDEKKLDFVEVMACPGGCVNGGGQMKPVIKATQPVDEEGYTRPLPEEGVDEGMRWSTKEWVEKVEDIYWTGLPTPPPSPPAEPLDEVGWEKRKIADELADKVLADVIGNDDVLRDGFLRCGFKKVEGDVMQDGLTHEAVKW